MKIRYGNEVDYSKLKLLFNQVGWSDKAKDISRLKEMVNNSQVVVTAWINQEMIGFARCTTDFVYNGQINNVVVDKNFRGKGIGKKLIQKITDSSELVTYILRGDEENIKFYCKMGFEEAKMTMVYRRKK